MITASADKWIRHIFYVEHWEEMKAEILVADTPHARIYDRLLEMCAPVCVSGTNFRKATAQES